MNHSVNQTVENNHIKTWVSRAVASVLMCIAVFALSSCERAAENIAEEILKPYCYNENGQTVCYANPK